MEQPYKFTFSSDPMPSLSLKECKETGCRGRCTLSPVKAYVLELKKRMEAKGLTHKDDDLLPPKGFEETDDLNPFQIVADIYRRDNRGGLEACLDRKMNIEDCVYGCYSGITDKDKLLVHPHQRRVHFLYRGALINMSGIIANDMEGKKFSEFEDIVKHLDSLKEKNRVSGKSKGYGNLCIFDTALRLAWHAPERQKEKLMPTKVWLQQGAKEGADCLDKLGQLKKSPFRHDGFKNRWVLDPKDLPVPIGEIEPFHIENLLCIFHPLFERWQNAQCS